MNECRQNYRKNLRLTGYLVYHNHEKEFCIHNLSKDGFMAHFNDFGNLRKDTALAVRLPEMKLQGYVYPVWEKPTGNGACKMGFKVLSLKGIDGFQFTYRPNRRMSKYAKAYMEISTL